MKFSLVITYESPTPDTTQTHKLKIIFKNRSDSIQLHVLMLCPVKHGHVSDSVRVRPQIRLQYEL